MDVIRLSDLMALMQASHGPCVTIMMGTHVTGPDQEQDALALRNLADRAQDTLATGWLRASQARDWLEPVRNCSSDPDFWEKRNLGLALFLDSKSLKRFRVPIPLEELVLVNHRFFIKPLLRLVSGNQRFLILSVSQHHICLYEASEFQIELVATPNLPQRIQETLNIEGEDRGQQRHMANRWRKGKQTSVFHGQGGAKGDYSSQSQLHQKAWPIARPHLLTQQTQVAERIRDLTHSDRATCDPQTAIKAACEGRVDTLLVDIAAHRWGRCDQFGQVYCTHEHPQPGDDDLLDHAAAQTMLHGGKVIAVDSLDMPTGAPIAALLRY